MNEQLRVVISAEISKFKQNIDNAKKTIKDFVKDGTKDFDKLNEEFQKVGEKSRTVLKTVGIAIAGAATALLALGASTKEYRAQQAQLNTAFETAGASAEVAKKTYNDLYRVLGDSGQATEAAQHLAKLTSSEKELSEWTTICQGVYAQFGSSLPLESLTEAVNHSAKLGEVQGTLADALEWSGVSVDKFNEQLFWCNSESEREKLIRDTLNGIYSESAATYEKNAADVLAQNEAQSKLNDSMARLGEVTAPIMTMLTELATDVLAQLTPYLEEFVNKYGDKIADALVEIGKAIGDVIRWIVDNWDIVSTLAIVIAATSTALSVFSTVMGIVNAVMLASPVTWIVLGIVAAIAALVAIIAVVIKYWDEIKGAGERAVQAIKNAWSTVADWFNRYVVQPIANFFSGLWNFISGVATNIKDGVVGAFTFMRDGVVNVVSGLVNGVKSVFSKITDFLTKPVEKARDAIKTVIDKIKGFFSFDWKLPKLKLPRFSVTPSGWSIGDLLKGVIPKLGITWNARGGVFDKPTLFNYGNSLQGIGENGAEAVVPLENNLEWLNKLADMLADKLGTNTPIVLQVDGKTFAKTAISTINSHTRQTGKLALEVR